MATIFDLRHAQTWNRIPSSLSLLPDPENVGVAVGISLLSCIRAGIHVISYLLPVNGRHRWLTTCPNTEQDNYYLLRVYGTENVLLLVKWCCYHVY